MKSTMGLLRHTFTLLLAAAPLLGLCGCREQNKTMLFHAGAGQRSSLNELKAVFEQRNPDVAVNFSYKGSGYFLADIARSSASPYQLQRRPRRSRCWWGFRWDTLCRGCACRGRS